MFPLLIFAGVLAKMKLSAPSCGASVPGSNEPAAEPQEMAVAVVVQADGVAVVRVRGVLGRWLRH